MQAIKDPKQKELPSSTDPLFNPDTTQFVSIGPVRVPANRKVSLEMKLKLPRGHHLKKDRTSFWRLTAPNQVEVLTPDLVGHIEDASKTTIPVKLKQDRAYIHVEALTYHENKKGEELVDPVLFRVQLLEDSEAKAKTVKLEVNLHAE